MKVASTARRIFDPQDKKTFATISATSRHMRCSKVELLDHFVGEQQKRLWNCQPEHLGGLKVDNELKLRRVLHWQVGRLGTTQYAVDISRRLLKFVQPIDAIRDQSTSFGIKSQWIERRQTQASG